MNSYAYWKTYIAGGRSKIDRPIGGSRTKRAYLDGNGNIRLRLHYTDVVTLHPDGTETINTGGWDTVTTKRFLSEHSRARVWSESYQLFVRVADPEITAPKVWKCRKCHGTGEVPQECYGTWQRCPGGPSCSGPRYCFPSLGECTHDQTTAHPRDECDHGETERHSLGACEHGRQEAHKVGTCSHGQQNRHALPNAQCYQCQGSGRYDYGSKAVHYAWSGGPLRIDANGFPITSDGTHKASKAAPKPASTETVTDAPSYSDSGPLLRAALPALRAQMTCPHCTLREQLQTVIIHLNDSAKWTRGQVADWLDTLDLDLSFPVPDHIPAHIH